MGWDGMNIQSKTNKIISQLFDKKMISIEQQKWLKINNGVAPKIYFLPKIHKLGTPLRPIVSFIGSPLYNLTKLLSNILQHFFIKDERYVKNSFDFANYIKEQTVPEGYILVSLDVVSLFTNIPVDLVTDIITQKWHLIRPNTSLDLETVVFLFNFCIENNYFQHGENFSTQIFGLGMENCMSPICSDIVMAQLQDQCISELSFNVPFFCRYVDDIITAIPNKKENEILSVFNSFHPRLQFTIEQEINCSLPFLDVKVIRSTDGTIKTDWYQKPTFSERILNYFSEHPMTHKINVIKNLKHRCLRLSSPEYQRKNLHYVQTILKKNNYPLSIIKKIINHTENITQNITRNNENNQLAYFKIPYINTLSHKIKKTIQSKSDVIKISEKNENSVRKHFFTKLKTKDAFDLHSNIIYKIPCSGCDVCYIGQTGRYLRQRLYEHEYDCRNLALKKNPTALAEHKMNTGHNFNFGKTTIMGQQQLFKKRLLAEMINIKKHNNAVNKRTDIDNLSSSYFNLIDQIKM
ncbi:uncharacterized protein LOC126750390 [Anthonomus grandis grandis]|uniref:uncharacterized protein LOC126750390 n=1 Tax=Anthonomus grandis grandis TaxID=2921223 RepID=UPI002166BF24|nr:uncharacterized protein LOC126750390 [Anthonomus grandis grandis]